MAYSEIKSDLTELDELIAEVRASRSQQCDLLTEHLQSARIYALGGMPEEYALSLELALQLSSTLQDEAVRTRLERSIQSFLPEADH